MTGYEIHNGRTTVNGEPFCRLADGTPEGCVCKNVFGTYLHGLFDSGELTQALVKLLCARKGISPKETRPASMGAARQKAANDALIAQLTMMETRLKNLEDSNAARLDGVRGALDMGAVYRAMGIKKAGR